MDGKIKIDFYIVGFFMVELWLVRHGQTNWNIEGRYQGSADIPLNSTGMEQARKLADQLDGNQFHAIYCSDLIRAKETAAILAKKLDVPIFIDSRLREINQGDWEGILFTDIKKEYPKEMIQRKENPIYFQPPGGESVKDVSKRIISIMGEIYSANSEQKIIIVSHGLTLSVLICLANHLPLSEAYQHIPDNAEPLIVQWD